jgi:transcription termination/antitermination protein NusG
MAKETQQAWYILRTYPGVEPKVKRSLVDRFQTQNLAQDAYQIVILVEEDENIVFSGFVLLKMQINTTIWTLIRNTPGVTGFAGMGNTPTPFYSEDWKDLPLQRYVN